MQLQEIAHRNKIEVIRDELEKIQSDNADGFLTAEDVVAAAQPPEHPLHSFFEWSDDVAAAQYRLLQARTIIRKVRVLPSENGDSSKSVPKYVSLYTDRKRKGGGYRQTSDVISDKDLMTELEATAKKELQGWIDRHAALTSLCHRVAKAAKLPVRKQTRKG